MKKGKILIGTSGWSYKGWKNIFYPSELPPTDYLSFYAKYFKTTEINTSFYHLPQEKTIINWAAKVPENFKFCPKISRYLTHMKKLKDPDEPLQRFFNVFEPLQHLCGPVLVQLPPSLAFDYARTQYFFELLKNHYSNYDFALEIRHPSWLAIESLDLLSDYNIAFVISQSGVNFPYAELVTSKNIYIRFHGPEALYASSYTDEMLFDFAERCINWSAKGHSIWAFFNNDINGHALNNAQTLIKMVTGKLDI